MIDYGFGVNLRRLEDSDMKFLFNCRNEYEVYKWCRQYAPLHWKNHLEWLDWQRKDSSTEMFAIWTKEPESLVGVCGLTSIDKINGRGEFSLYIAPTFWRRGFGAAALDTLFMWGFRQLRLNRIWGETFDKNPAAHLFESLGMVKEGTRKQFYFKEGEYVDAHLFSISAAEFNDLHSALHPQNRGPAHHDQTAG